MNTPEPCVTLTPEVIERPALTLVGCEGRFFGAMSPAPTNMTVIPPLWSALFARAAEITDRVGTEAYGACRCIGSEKNARDGELIYLAGFAVAANAPVPTGMAKWTLPAATYAKFTHRGPIWKIGETMKAIHTMDLGAAGLVRREGVELECYDDRFRDGGESSELDVFVPVHRAP